MTMFKNSNLTVARKMKNDEFYTRRIDIETELSYYEMHFKDKTVYCNCDDPEKSEFWSYFYENFTKWGLKRLISTHYGKNAYRFDYDGRTCIKICLTGDGDFRSTECVDLFKEADIIVTNPPFSLFREYVAQLMEYKKKFLIVGSMNAITYKEFFPLLKDNKVWLGYTHPKIFVQPDGTIKNVYFRMLIRRKETKPSLS